ncbi:uncharacterized protein LOC115080307 [Rhinatrema bivittatum]|uniref:uncharacterized protein LOC115080307 n=1 Tax=Rhinatrema bivittatum TaxID=194408 RepID=UPI0011299F2B|nr:uncharacterized protein LOC115080307 [Rhinatrema bivittatum]
MDKLDNIIEGSSSCVEEVVSLKDDASSTPSCPGRVPRIRSHRKQQLKKKNCNPPKERFGSQFLHCRDVIKPPRLTPAKCQALSRKKTAPKRSRSKTDSSKANQRGNQKPKTNISPPCIRDGKKIFKSKWRGSAKFKKWGPNACVFLPVPEDIFIEDMISENPCYKSNSQLKSREYWENVAAVLPSYQGSCCCNSPENNTLGFETLSDK